MTTIAWDGEMIAADSLARSSQFDRHVNKIFTIKPGLYFAGCGDWQDCLAVAKYLSDPMNKEPELEDDFKGIIIEDGICYTVESKLIKDQVKEKHYSIGSGASHAIVAMFLGQTAGEALHTTMKFDADTGGTIQWINVKQLADVPSLAKKSVV